MIQSKEHLGTDRVRKIAFERNQALKAIRRFFDSHGYIEIDAPVLISANAVESYIDPLHTLVEAPDRSQQHRLYLMTSPEIYMKRLLARGLEKIYFLGHVFRDHENSPIHRNEFAMLEWYQAESTLETLISESEFLFQEIALSIHGTTSITLHNRQIIQLKQPFQRLSMAEAWEKFAQIDLLACLKEIAEGNCDALVHAVLKSGECLRESANFEDAFTHIMLKKIETQIGWDRPCVLIDWPAQTAALAALHPQNSLLAQRFEIYCGGMELANAFVELTDPKEQALRFELSNQIRIDSGRDQLPIDQDFLSDLSEMPIACGIALGIDRLFALVCGQNDLDAVALLNS